MLTYKADNINRCRPTVDVKVSVDSCDNIDVSFDDKVVFYVIHHVI